MGTSDLPEIYARQTPTVELHHVSNNIIPQSISGCSFIIRNTQLHSKLVAGQCNIAWNALTSLERTYFGMYYLHFLLMH